jgi:uncharacterized SAM-binding protein YcdF (DUF218 family)
VPPLTSSPASRFRRLLGAAALLLLAACVFAFINLGSFLAREDPLAKADVIFVLAGSDVERPLEAADLYNGGYAPAIVLTRERIEPALEALQRRGITPPFEIDWQRSVLTRLGVPADAVIVPERVHGNTAQEAQTLRRLATEHHWRRVIVVSSKYHLRRARMAFRRELRGLDVSVAMRGTRYDPSVPERWWTRRADIRWLLSELPKFAAYSLGLGA